MNASLHTLSSSPVHSANSKTPVANATQTSSRNDSAKKARARHQAASASSRRHKSRRAVTNAAGAIVPDATLQEFRDCLQQAEICHAQAQEAARLKRFKAARGLFSTAIALCQRALGLREKRDVTASKEAAPSSIEASANTALPNDNFDAAANDAQQTRAYLHELTIEMSTYSELARSMERPLRPNSTP